MHLLLPVFNLWVIKHNLTCNFPFLSYELKAFYPLTVFEIMERETHKISVRVCPWTDVAPVYTAKVGWSTVVGTHDWQTIWKSRKVFFHLNHFWNCFQLWISHFRVPLGLCIKTRLSAQPLIWKSFFVLMQIKLIFTRKLVHLASFWKWGFLELGRGLLE